MSNEDIFNTPEQEVEMVAKELSEIKDILRDLSRRLSRIEARASRAFPGSMAKHANPPKADVKSEASLKSTMTADEVMSLYDKVVDQAKGGNIEKARELLDALGSPDLNLLRSELGVSLGKKKPSRRILMEAVLGRVSESVMMTKHIDRTQLISQGNDENPTVEKPEEERQ